MIHYESQFEFDKELLNHIAYSTIHTLQCNFWAIFFAEIVIILQLLMLIILLLQGVEMTVTSECESRSTLLPVFGHFSLLDLRILQLQMFILQNVVTTVTSGSTLKFYLYSAQWGNILMLLKM